MKFVLNKIPEDKNFNPQENGWISFKEPSSMYTTSLLSIFISLLNLLIVICFFKIFKLNSNILNIIFSNNFLSFLFIFIIIFPIHEFLHALSCPCSLTSNDIYFGFIPKKIIFFTYYKGILSKKRYLIVSIMPFLVITLAGILLAKLFGNDTFFQTIILCNALESYMDILGVLIILLQVPKNAVIKNEGIKSYWKL